MEPVHRHSGSIEMNSWKKAYKIFARLKNSLRYSYIGFQFWVVICIHLHMQSFVWNSIIWFCLCYISPLSCVKITFGHPCLIVGCSVGWKSLQFAPFTFLFYEYFWIAFCVGYLWYPTLLSSGSSCPLMQEVSHTCTLWVPIFLISNRKVKNTTLFLCSAVSVPTF